MAVDTNYIITQTSYARQYALFNYLKRGKVNSFLKSQNRPLRGLVVGAGMAYDHLLFNLKVPILGINPFEEFSWEYMELMTVLRMIHPESTVSVVDISEEVCDRLRKQSAVPVHDYYDKVPAAYHRNFLTAFDHQKLDREALSRMNRELSRIESSRHLRLIARVKVPQIEAIVNADFLSENLNLDQYDVVTLMNSTQYMRDMSRIPERVTRSLRPQGLVLFVDDDFFDIDDFENAGFRTLKHDRHSERNDDGEAVSWQTAILRKEG